MTTVSFDVEVNPVVLEGDIEGIVLQGPAGTDGTDGIDGVGVPAGGTTGQSLTKNSNTDYDTHWSTVSGGGGAALTVKDEGSNLSTAVTSIDFAGAGVTATGTTAVTVTVPGGTSFTALHSALLGVKVWSSGSSAYVWSGDGTAPDSNSYTNIIFIDPTATHDPASSTGGRSVANDLWETGTPSFIADNAVTNAKLADIATARIKGRVTASTGDPEDLTGTQATTLLDTFTSSLKGLAPSSGGGTSNFLRADASWAPPTSAYPKSVRATRTSGDITLNSTSPANVDTGLDLVIAAAAGDVLQYNMSGWSGSENVVVGIDVYTIVSGSPLHSFGNGVSASLGTSAGVGNWVLAAASNYHLAGGPQYVVVSGDIVSGNVTCRLRYATFSAANRTLVAGTNRAFQVSVTNLGPN